jgi:flagellar protein FliS
MTFENARTSYRRAETFQPADVNDPHEIIGVTLQELKKSLTVLAAAQENGGNYPAKHLNRAFTAIYILQSSLDFEAGGEIATNLFQVYEFCRLQVADAFSRHEEAKLALAAQHIDGICSAWAQIGSAATQGAV